MPYWKARIKYTWNLTAFFQFYTWNHTFSTWKTWNIIFKSPDYQFSSCMTLESHQGCLSTTEQTPSYDFRDLEGKISYFQPILALQTPLNLSKRKLVSIFIIYGLEESLGVSLYNIKGTQVGFLGYWWQNQLFLAYVLSLFGPIEVLTTSSQDRSKHILAYQFPSHYGLRQSLGMSQLNMKGTKVGF